MNQQVLRDPFPNDKGIVDSLTHKGLQDAQNVTPKSRMQRRHRVSEFTFLEQLHR